MNFKQALSEKTDIVNSYLTLLAPKNADERLLCAINYSLNAGGKRIRPILALSVCQMLGGDEKSVMHFACALEYIHTYSLMHDDLPCMDDDDLRRGVPACHIKFGEAMALLAGDALLNHAFEVISHAPVPAAMIVDALKVISTAGGVGGMIGGQARDLKGATALDDLISLHGLKTGAIISAAAKVGVIASGKKDETIQSAIASYAESLGIAFQIKDDILDVVGNEQEIGKRTGHDASSGKKTFVHFAGLKGAHDALEKYTKRAKSSLQMFGEKGNFLYSFADYLLGRDN
ncbi:MAG: polyprenyl synthetase family protein [Firmicutes bacterium]|nr:polyprenyl synthetase family protein [Bacillota bacterium]